MTSAVNAAKAGDTNYLAFSHLMVIISHLYNPAQRI